MILPNSTFELPEPLMSERRGYLLAAGSGQLRLGGPEPLGLSRIAELVETRLEGLAAEERALLELMAFGEVLGRGEVASLADPEVLTALERRGLVSARHSGRRLELRVTDPLHTEVLRALLPRARRRQIARWLAEAVEARGGRRRDDPLRVASWRLICGGGHPQVMLAGALDACQRHDYPFAEKLSQASVDAASGEDEDTRFDAALLAARLAGRQGRFKEAEHELKALVARAASDDQRGVAALARLENSVMWTGTDRLGVLDQAEATISDLRWRAVLRAQRIPLILDVRGPRAAARSTAQFLQQDRGEALGTTWISRAYSLSRLGRVSDALDAARRGQSSLTTAPATPAFTDADAWLIATQYLTLGYAGRFEEAEALATDHYRAALTHRSLEAQALLASMRAATVAERGQVKSAITQTSEALALCQQLGRPIMVRLSLIYNALACALHGRGQAAKNAISAVRNLDLPALLSNEVDLIRAQAWTAAASGNLAEARRQMERAANLGNDIGDLMGEIAALHGLARLGLAGHVSERLATASSRVEGALAPARLGHTEALARNDAAGLEAASREFEAMGAHLLAAEAAADASAAHRHADRRSAANAAKRRASILADRCEGARTPALQAIEIRGLLTSAEWETALMAAHGQPSRRIASDLCLSIRTIENRLQRVYEKLGISSRGRLTEAFVR